MDASTVLMVAGVALVLIAVLARKPKGSTCSGDLLAEVNAWRGRGAVCDGMTYTPVPPVVIHPTLQHVAQLFANDLAMHKIRAGHVGSDGSELGDRLLRAGYRWSWAGENTAYGTQGAATTIAAFAASPTHCQTLMSAHATHCGLACASDGKNAYWVQVMARPA